MVEQARLAKQSNIPELETSKNDSVKSGTGLNSKNGGALKDFDVIDSDPEEEISAKELSLRLGIFTCFWTSALFGNLDTGVIPTTLH